MLVSRGDAEYTLTEEDVDQCMVFVYTPVNWEGKNLDYVGCFFPWT
jgi:hypothetical protein